MRNETIYSCSDYKVVFQVSLNMIFLMSEKNVLSSKQKIRSYSKASLTSEAVKTCSYGDSQREKL